MKEAIIKYSNRKMYCKKRKTYVTLLDIYIDYKHGNKIKVVSHKTKEDITSRTILQSIIDFADENDCAMVLSGE